MATINGTFASNNKNLNLYITYSSSQTTSSNKSSVTAKLYVKRVTSYATTYKNNTPYSITINGNTKSGTFDFNAGSMSVGSSKLIASHTVSVTHNSDGTKSIKIGGSFDLSGCNPGKGTIPSTSITLPRIPRQTTPTVTASANVGSAVTISLSSRASSNFTHTLRYVCGSATGTIVTKTSSTSVSFTLPTSLLSVVSGTSATVNIYCKTYSGSTQIGSETKCTTTVKIPSTYAPTISGATKTCLTNATNSAITGVYLAGVSQIKVVISATAATGASISQYGLSVNGVYTYSKSNTVTSPVITTTGSLAIKVWVKDSRGYTAEISSGAITVSDYTKPQITSFVFVRKGYDENNNLVDMPNGDRVYITLAYSFSSAINSKYRKYSLKYGTSSASLTEFSTASSTSFTITGLSAGSSYVLNYTIDDGVSKAVKTANVSSIYPLLSLSSDGTGLGVGCKGESGTMKVNIPITMTPNKHILGVRPDGTTAGAVCACDGVGNTTFGYGSYKDSRNETHLYGNIVKIFSRGDIDLLGGNVHMRDCYVQRDDGSGSYWNIGNFSGSDIYGSTQGICYIGNCMILYGKASIEESDGTVTAGKLYSKAITFRNEFALAPAVMLTPNSTVSTITVLGVTGVSTTGANIRFKRSDAGSTTNIFWIAIGKRAT